jgi:hypothetical protein
MRRIRVFFYGLFMDEALLRSRGIDAGESSRASLPGFRLRIGRRATLVADDAGIVHGMAGLLSHQARLRALAERLNLPARYVASIEWEGDCSASE